MKISKIIARALSLLLRAWVTACAAVMMYVPMSVLAFSERGYRAIGGEIVPVVLVAIAVWYGMGRLMKVWYRDMIGRHSDED